MTSSRSQPEVRRRLNQRRGTRAVALLTCLLLLSGLVVVSTGAAAAGESTTASDDPGAVATPVPLADAELLVHASPGWVDSATDYLDQPDGQRILYECRADLAGVAVWVYGTDVYSADSQVCYAAVHAGVITLDAGGPAVIEMGPPAPTYVGSTRNGITSEDDEWPDGRSFVVLDADDVQLPPESQDLPAGRLVVDHTELELGTVAIGGSASATLTVRNDGDGALTVHEVALDEHLSGQFHVRDGTVTTSPLAPGEERILEVEFTPVTRAQMTSLLIRAVRWSTQQPLEATAGPYFSDVDGVHTDNIDAAHELGLAAGRTDGTFGPGLDIRRDQMASLLVRAYDLLVAGG